MSEDKKYTVGDLKAMLRDLPDDMPLFRFDDRWPDCVQVDEMPQVIRVFEHDGLFYQAADIPLWKERKIDRQLDVLKI